MKAVIAALALATSITALPGTAGAFDRQIGYEYVRGDHARFGWSRHDILPERRIERIVYREGFVEISDLRLRRDRYVVDAIRPNGAVFRLALDAYDGSLVSRERIGWAHGPDRREQARRPDGIEFRFNF